MKKIIFIFLILAAIAGSIYVSKRGSWLVERGAVTASTEAVRYQCPMHPQIIQDHPGNCPICGMHLVKVERVMSVDPQAQRQKKVAFYRNPMDPKITSPVSMKDSMGMDYIAVYEEDSSRLPLSEVEGHGAIHLSDEKMKSIGVRTEEVKRKKMTLPLRLIGSVFHNHEVFEMLMAYRDAIQVEQRVKKPTVELLTQTRAQAATLRNKLRRYGIDDEVFKKAEASLADPSSFVPAQLIFEANGAYVDVRLPVSDSAHVQLGQKGDIHSPASPDHKLEGVIRSIDSIVDPATQTFGVRFEVVSGHEHLKPGMFVTVEMNLDLGESLTASQNAIFSPGKKSYVFVETATGVFLPKYIEVGISAGPDVQILKGLTEGEKVVVSANFLLDSESRFQAAREEVGHD